MSKPGTAIFHACGLTPNATSALWDGWGVEGCRREKRQAHIVKRLRLAYGVRDAGKIVECTLAEMPVEQKGFGLGDAVEWVVKKIWPSRAKKPCGSCKERKAKLNRIRLK